MSDGGRDDHDARLADGAEGWTILDVLADDASGKRFLVQCGDGSSLQVTEPDEEQQSSLAYRERFKAKVARAREVEHECIVPTLGFAEDAGKLYLVEPNAEGASLAELSQAEQALDADAVLEVGLQVARALGELHRNGLVHGWVRPDAILVTDERALLRGCGLEHPQGEETGQPEFMSPEQLSERRSLRPESDFFSLGATLFAAVVGRPPFRGETPGEIADAIRQGRPTFPGRGEPKFSKNVAFLFAKLLAADPEQRARSAKELIADVEAVRAGRPIGRVTEQPPPPPPRRNAPPKKSGRKALIAAAAAVVLALVAGVLLLLPRDRGKRRELLGPAPTTSPAQTTPPAVATTGPAGTPLTPREPTREERAQEAYEKAGQYTRAHPRDFDEIIRRFKDVATKYPGTRVALTAEQRATEYTLKKNTDKLSDFADVQAEADKLVKQKRFGEAVAAFNRYDVLLAAEHKLTPELRDKIKSQLGFIRTEAAAAYDEQSKKAAEAVKAQRYEEAIEIYEKIVLLYGMDELARRARTELGIIRPLLATRDKAAAAKRLRELEQAYRETAAEVQKLVKAFDLERAVTRSERLLGQLKGSALEPNAARHLGHLKRLLALKQRVIEKVNRAARKLKSESLGIRAPASVIESADAAGIVLKSKAGAETRPWVKLSDWEKYSIARKVSDLDSRDDLTALGLLSLEQGNLARAAEDLKRAKRFGADVGDLLARVKKAGPTTPPKDDRPARMLIEARALVAEKKWLDALVLLIPLKEKHAGSNYAIREKLDEINAMLAKCSRGLTRADIERDIAAGVETALLTDGIKDWDRRGKGWSFQDGRVTCDNQAEHDIDLLKSAQPAPAYRLSVRCRALSGNGLMIRVASDGDNHYDFWLGLAADETGKTGLWHSSGGRPRKNQHVPVRVTAGDWIDVRAIVTGRHVRVECAGQSCQMPSRLGTGPDAKRSYGLITRQKSKAEFEDLRIRILREQ